MRERERGREEEREGGREEEREGGRGRMTPNKAAIRPILLQMA